MCELYYYIEGPDAKRPADLAAGTAVQIAEWKTEQTMWDRKSNNACGTITQLLHPNICNTIKDFKSPAKVMEHLKKLFDISQSVGRN